MDERELKGKKFEEAVLSKLNEILPQEAIILYDMYFLTETFINDELGYKSLQFDIIIIYKGLVFILECKFLSDENYTRLEFCKSKQKKYRGKYKLYRMKRGREVRIRKAFYGLKQNESHMNYLNKMFDEKVKLKAITIFGNISEDKLPNKNTRPEGFENNYFIHFKELDSYLNWAINDWTFKENDASSIKEFLEENEWRDVNREELHKRQVDYFENKR